MSPTRRRRLAAVTNTTVVVQKTEQSGVSTGTAVGIGLLSFGIGMAVGASINNSYYPYPMWGYGGMYYGGRPYYPPPYRPPYYPGYHPAYGYHPPANYHWNQVNRQTNITINNNNYYNKVNNNSNNRKRSNTNVNRPGQVAAGNRPGGRRRSRRIQGRASLHVEHRPGAGTAEAQHTSRRAAAPALRDQRGRRWQPLARPRGPADRGYGGGGGDAAASRPAATPTSPAGPAATESWAAARSARPVAGAAAAPMRRAVVAGRAPGAPAQWWWWWRWWRWGEEALMRNPRRRDHRAAQRCCCSLAGCGKGEASGGQTTFTTPDEAVTAFVAAARANNTAALDSMLGPGGAQIVTSSDTIADQAERARFVERYDEKHALVENGADTLTLNVGATDWPMPIPLVKAGDKWHWDGEAGKEEVFYRRIGHNELKAIASCRAVVDAQQDYAAASHDGKPAGSYRPRIISQPGRQDGLYWATQQGEPPSPLGPGIAAAGARGIRHVGCPHALPRLLLPNAARRVRVGTGGLPG